MLTWLQYRTVPAKYTSETSTGIVLVQDSSEGELEMVRSVVLATLCSCAFALHPTIRLNHPPCVAMTLLDAPWEQIAAFAAGALVGALAKDTGPSDPNLRPTPLSEIFVRPGKGKFGVGLICVRDVPAHARICKCFPPYSKTVSMSSLDTLPPEVREVIHEMWDCVNDPPGKCLVPSMRHA